MAATATLTGLRTASATVTLALCLGIAALGVLFFPEGRAAVGVWIASTAYGHCFLILPMAAYLAWERRASFMDLPAEPEARLALLALPVAASWFAADRLGIMEGRQLVAIAAFELLFLVVLGRLLFRALLAPLAYLVFLVPFGAFFTPALQQFTARFAVLGLNVLGIPNFADDLIIEIPAGVFYVAEACAGLRFLIAAIAFGVFYALLNYRSPGRRLVFIAASIVVPIVANGFRALGIVVLGQILGSAEAAAADHVIYGWVFFSFVMLLLVAAGLPLREPPASARPAPARTGPARVPSSPWLAAFAVWLVVACGPAAAALFDLRAGPVSIAAVPALALPPDCALAGEPPAVPAARIVLHVTCGEQAWEVMVQAYSPRSTAESLLSGRRRATGELGAEDVVTSPLATADPGNGSWLLVDTTDPSRITAIAAWVDGAPAQGGIAGRIQQARNSVFGTPFAPVLVTVATDLPARIPVQNRRALVDTARRLIDAQSGLTAQLAAMSRAPG